MRIALENKSDENDKDELKVSGRIINNLRFADDIALLAKSLKSLQELLNNVNNVSAEHGMENSHSKTE